MLNGHLWVILYSQQSNNVLILPCEMLASYFAGRETFRFYDMRDLLYTPP